MIHRCFLFFHTRDIMFRIIDRTFCVLFYSCRVRHLRRPGLDQFIYYSTVHPLYLLCLCRSSTGYCMVYRVLRLNYCLYLLHYFRGYCLNKYPINKCEQYTYLKVLNLDEFLTSFLLFIYLLSTWLTNFVE